MNCISCNRTIQEVTYRLNSGLCGPCKRGAVICSRCGKTLFNHPKKSPPPYICYSCSVTAIIAGRTSEIAIEGVIDWARVEDDFVLAGGAALSRVIALGPELKFGALVVEIGQNWVFELHMTTAAAHASIADAEKWRYESWDYTCISHEIGRELNDLNRKNYEFFEKRDLDEVSDAFDLAAQRAALRLLSSTNFRELSSRHPLSGRVADEDGLDFFTKEYLK